MHSHHANSYHIIKSSIPLILSRLHVLLCDSLRGADQLDHAHVLLHYEKQSCQEQPNLQQQLECQGEAQNIFEIADVAKTHEQPITCTKTEQHGFVFVVKVERRESASELLMVLPSARKGRVHLKPMRSYIQKDVPIENPSIPRVQSAQKRQGHCIRRPVAHHVEDSSKISGLVEFASRHSVDCIESRAESAEEESEVGVFPIGEDGGNGEGIANIANYVGHKKEDHQFLCVKYN